MKIGFFDSGLGGLQILRAVVKKLPRYDVVYLGDTKRVPYGNRSLEVIHEFTRQGVEFLFQQNCKLVILACNTVSTNALRRIQHDYLPRYFPNRRVLGMIVPTVEELDERGIQKAGLIATTATVRSNAYGREIKKIDPSIRLLQRPAPLLVPLVELGGLAFTDAVLKKALRPLLKRNVEAIVLACTHYSILKRKVRRIVGPNVRIISQDEIIPKKLKNYLKRHPEIDRHLSKLGHRTLYVTDLTPETKRLARRWFGTATRLQAINLG
ncbi:MAG: glutamate racemase [Candidatus Kerfeldbacteria bacterium]|nr:glutamate racemase [Candidatus Kerfeldbacteria bacterium]